MHGGIREGSGRKVLENKKKAVTIYLDEKEGVIATQYQMKELEELGLLKIDFLGYRYTCCMCRYMSYSIFYSYC